MNDTPGILGARQISEAFARDLADAAAASGPVVPHAWDWVSGILGLGLGFALGLAFAAQLLAARSTRMKHE